jgi:hypothetical protein
VTLVVSAFILFFGARFALPRPPEEAAG